MGKEMINEIRLGGKNPKSRIKIGKDTLIMAILNVTQDSFYDGGKYLLLDDAVRYAEQLVKEGADIIDIGGESTRPGSEPVSLDEEIKRVIPVIEKLAESVDIPISIDTQKAEVARQALEFGASMVNDVSAMRTDPEMVSVVKGYDVPIVLMHMKGNPKDMQENPYYSDVISELKGFFKERINWAKANGVKEENIILDPGIGFGKLLEHNLEILRRLCEFKELGRPVLVGPSRKSFIGKILDKTPDERIWGTAGALAVAVMKGADIVRVHDVREMRDVANIVNRIRGRSSHMSEN